MLKIESPQIVWQAGKAPYSARFKNYYFGVDDGRAEADYIYIQGNNLANRFQTLVKHTPPPHEQTIGSVLQKQVLVLALTFYYQPAYG